MAVTKWLLIPIRFAAAFVLLQGMMVAQEQISADEVISKYLQAVGADRVAGMTTFIERGDLYGNLTNFLQGSSFDPTQSQKKQRGTFEFYFKSPNRRFSSTVTEDNRILALHGCNGEVSWYINAFLERKEFKPKPGSEYDCETGFTPMPHHFREANTKIRLIKKKETEGRMAWEIRVDIPRSTGPEIYYFDAETYLLLRREAHGSTITYSDYRDVGGFKLPFKITNDLSNITLVTTVRELRINAPIDDARFIEPEVKAHKVIVANPAGSSQTQPVENANAALDANAATGNKGVAANIPAPTNAASVTQVNFPDFTCALADLLMIVPELKGLKAASDQQRLQSILDKVGAKTLDIARNTPNLISRESVTSSLKGAAETRHDYDYLILTRVEGHMVGLDEFRVDIKTGEKFRTHEGMGKTLATVADVEQASHELSASQSGAPVSQGFATAWVHFYPLNRPQAEYRYLGEQKVDGKRSFVLAFAQKPAAVLSPALFRYQGKTVPMFLQGVAWVDASDFRIFRLRTDLLSPLPEVSLHRLTVDIRFVPTRIEQVSSLLSLPGDVMVTSEVGGSSIRETHQYSDYRLFRAQSRVVLNP